MPPLLQGAPIRRSTVNCSLFSGAPVHGNEARDRLQILVVTFALTIVMLITIRLIITMLIINRNNSTSNTNNHYNSI